MEFKGWDYEWNSRYGYRKAIIQPFLISLMKWTCVVVWFSAVFAIVFLLILRFT